MRKVTLHILCLLGSWFDIRFIFWRWAALGCMIVSRGKRRGETSVFYSVQSGQAPTTAFIVDVIWHTKEFQGNVLGQRQPILSSFSKTMVNDMKQRNIQARTLLYS